MRTIGARVNKKLKKIASELVPNVDEMMKVSLDKGIDIADEINGLATIIGSGDDNSGSEEETRTDKLTDWAKEPTQADLENDLLEASSYQNMVKEKLIKYKTNMEGGPEIAKQVGKSNVRPRLIRKQAEWRYPSLE